MEIDRKTMTAALLVPPAVVACFSAFFFMDTRHAHHQDVEAIEVEVIRRDAMSEHTRWGQIVHHYTNVQKERPLTKAEDQRLDLARREIDRLSHKLLGED